MQAPLNMRCLPGPITGQAQLGWGNSPGPLYGARARPGLEHTQNRQFGLPQIWVVITKNAQRRCNLPIWCMGHQTLGRNHLEPAKTKGNVGVVHDAMGEYQKARNMYTEALPAMVATLGHNHPPMVNTQEK